LAASQGAVDGDGKAVGHNDTLAETFGEVGDIAIDGGVVHAQRGRAVAFHEDEADVPEVGQCLEGDAGGDGGTGHVRGAADDAVGEGVLQEVAGHLSGGGFVVAAGLGGEDVALQTGE